MLSSIYSRKYDLIRSQLRGFRLAAELTQADLAGRLKLDQSYVSKVERGERYVDLVLYVEWCRSCAVDPARAIDELLAVDAWSAGF